MYGVAALVLLHCGGALGEEVEGMLVGPLLMLSAAVGALAAGLPIWMLPAPLLAASGVAMFYETRALRDYLLFVAGALATGGLGQGQGEQDSGQCGAAGMICAGRVWGSTHGACILNAIAAASPLPSFPARRRLVCVAPLLVPGHHP